MSRLLTMCSVNDCTKASTRKGMCNAHYLRAWRHGSPTAGRAMDGEPLRWLKNHTKHNGYACLIWPFGTTGEYGTVRWQGKAVMANHLMTLLAHGPSPEGKPMAAHSCGNPPCCNPNHLRWASSAENQADRKIHGTDAGTIWARKREEKRHAST